MELLNPDILQIGWLVERKVITHVVMLHKDEQRDSHHIVVDPTIDHVWNTEYTGVAIEQTFQDCGCEHCIVFRIHEGKEEN